MLRASSIFVLVSCLSVSYAQYRSRCGQKAEEGTTLKETGDGIEGRYTVEWCSKLEDEATEWNFKMDYIDFHNGSNECPKSDSILASISLSRYLRIHSVFIEKLLRPFPDCEITCLSKPLDLVFSGCYVAQSQLSRLGGRRTWHRSMAALQVANRFDSAQAFNRIRPFVDIEKEGNSLIVTWDLHYIPVTNYSMEIAHYDHENDTEVKNAWQEIQENCTHDTYSIVCRLRAPPAGRCVAAALRHSAPWRRGALFKDANIRRYCSPMPSAEVVPARVGARAWWAAGALLCALAALAACWAAHSRVLASLRKRVLLQWTHRYASYAAERPADASGDILLLYARDCAPAMDAVAILKEMLEDGAPGRVFDLFAPDCVSLYAASPAEWLRGLWARAGVRVVLLETPAAAALYGAQPRDGLCLQEPLLGSRVQYRRPHYGDALLQLALRLARDAAPLPGEYAKYHVASIADLPSDTLPQVSAYRRYILPAHAPLLLQNLRLRSDEQATNQRLARLAAAIEKLQDYVRGNENYLRDELMFL